MRVAMAPLGAKIDEQQFILEVSPADCSGDKEGGGTIGNKSQALRHPSGKERPAQTIIESNLT